MEISYVNQKEFTKQLQGLDENLPGSYRYES